jgi:translation initiation factor 3 subunit D
MAPASLLDLVSALPDTAGWGPPVTSESMLDGVPFAPYSKADKLGRMADWTEGKDRERGGRQQYGNRNYRGMAEFMLQRKKKEQRRTVRSD